MAAAVSWPLIRAPGPDGHERPQVAGTASSLAYQGADARSEVSRPPPRPRKAARGAAIRRSVATAPPGQPVSIQISVCSEISRASSTSMPR